MLAITCEGRRGWGASTVICQPCYLVVFDAHSRFGLQTQFVRQLAYHYGVACTVGLRCRSALNGQY